MSMTLTSGSMDSAEQGIMRTFGRRSSRSNIAWLLKPKAFPVTCHILRRSERMICMTVSEPGDVTEKFRIISGSDTELCDLQRVGPNYVIARVSDEPVDHPNTYGKNQKVQFRDVLAS